MAALSSEAEARQLGPARLLLQGIEHEPGEIAIVLEAAKNRPHFADHELEHGDLLVQELQNPLLQRIAGHEVEHEYLALLADSIDAPDALLDRHRIPGHVEID